MIIKYCNDIKHLQEIIRSQKKILYCSSRTSRVLPFFQLLGTESEITCVDLSKLAPCIDRDDEGNVVVSGAVNWQQLYQYLNKAGLGLYPGPSEELASVLAGVATAATGSLSFGLGVLRDYIIAIDYCNASGDIVHLEKNKTLLQHDAFSSSDKVKLLQHYQHACQKYDLFKNGPYPKLEDEIDLLIGTEGQLGAIVKVWLRPLPEIKDTIGVFITLPSIWENDISGHSKFYQLIQNYRQVILACEFLDSNALNLVVNEHSIIPGKDVIFILGKRKEIEHFWDEQHQKLEKFEFFEIDLLKWEKIRESIPRKLSEKINQQKIFKKGTDAQVRPEYFKQCLKYYQNMAANGIEYCLFGHFGDAHLHFNFLPQEHELKQCEELLNDFYKQIALWEGSPFAEHGIGLIKQKYMHDFYGKSQREMFDYLKNYFDPTHKLFPNGYMLEN